MKHASSCWQERPLVYRSRRLMASTTSLATSQASARLSWLEVADRMFMLSPWNTSCTHSAFTQGPFACPNLCYAQLRGDKRPYFGAVLMEHVLQGQCIEAQGHVILPLAGFAASQHVLHMCTAALAADCVPRPLLCSAHHRQQVEMIHLAASQRVLYSCRC